MLEPPLCLVVDFLLSTRRDSLHRLLLLEFVELCQGQPFDFIEPVQLVDWSNFPRAGSCRHPSRCYSGEPVLSTQTCRKPLVDPLYPVLQRRLLGRLLFPLRLLHGHLAKKDNPLHFL